MTGGDPIVLSLGISEGDVFCALLALLFTALFAALIFVLFPSLFAKES